jgi:hypothetical protein
VGHRVDNRCIDAARGGKGRISWGQCVNASTSAGAAWNGPSKSQASSADDEVPASVVDVSWSAGEGAGKHD